MMDVDPRQPRDEPAQMSPANPCQIADDSTWRANDDELVALLRCVYVGGGFTDADVADVVFTPEAIRARGQLLCARGIRGTLMGTVMVVPPDSPARRLAANDEAEMHLLAVGEDCRGLGVGSALVDAAVAAARRAGYRGMVLWTQPTMVGARRLYDRAGFSRSRSEDFKRHGRSFHVYRRRF